jgi:hypothetical protein
MAPLERGNKREKHERQSKALPLSREKPKLEPCASPSSLCRRFFSSFADTVEVGSLNLQELPLV